MKPEVSKIAVGSLVLIPLLATGLFGFSKAELNLKETSQTNLDLQQIHPDEPIEDSLDSRFSFANSLERVKQIESALNSFQNLTEKSRVSLNNETLNEIGNTDWETQNLGFHNWVGSVKGTLIQQDYQIQKLEYELAKEQFEDGEINKTELDQKAADYQQAKQELQALWNTLEIAD